MRCSFAVATSGRKVSRSPAFAQTLMLLTHTHASSFAPRHSRAAKPDSFLPAQGPFNKHTWRISRASTRWWCDDVRDAADEPTTVGKGIGAFKLIFNHTNILTYKYGAIYLAVAQTYFPGAAFSRAAARPNRITHRKRKLTRVIGDSRRMACLCAKQSLHR